MLLLTGSIFYDHAMPERTNQSYSTLALILPALF
jgi:hypothetical protein